VIGRRPSAKRKGFEGGMGTAKAIGESKENPNITLIW